MKVMKMQVETGMLASFEAVQLECYSTSCHKAIEEAVALYYAVIKHSAHLRTLEKCRKHLPVACVFYINFPLCSQMSIMFCHSIIHSLGFFICYIKHY